MVVQKVIHIETPGRGTQDLSATIQAIVRESGAETGLCQVFVHHTSASLMLCENADPDVRRDLETFMADLAPDGDPRHTHTAEGADDMPAHIRSVLTQGEISIPIANGQCDLGTWQGIYLWEHRHAAHTRKLTVSVLG